MGTQRGRHPLAGWYLQPEFVFSAWSRMVKRYVYDAYFGYDPQEVKQEYTSAALILNFGHAFFLGDRVSLDLNAGLGYGAEWRNDTEVDQYGYGYGYDRQNYAFSHLFTGNTSPLVLSGGLRFGYLF